MIVIFRLFCVILLPSCLNASFRAWRPRKRYFEFFRFHPSSTLCSYIRIIGFVTWHDRLSLSRNFSSLLGLYLVLLTFLVVAWHWYSWRPSNIEYGAGWGDFSSNSASAILLLVFFLFPDCKGSNGAEYSSNILCCGGAATIICPIISQNIAIIGESYVLSKGLLCRVSSLFRRIYSFSCMVSHFSVLDSISICQIPWPCN
jgi:hypothetical protein